MTLANKHEIVDIIEQIAPQKYAIEQDNPGLHTGDTSGKVARCLVSLDVTESVVNEAISLEADMIIAHHPLFMEPIKSLSVKHLPSYVLEAVKRDLTVYSCHTNYDASPELSVNHALLGSLDLKINFAFPLEPTFELNYYKLAVFVPVGYEQALHSRIAEVGAGCLGNYSHASFQTSGMGTFCPLSGSNPAEGKINQLSQTNEIKIETIVSENDLSQIMKVLHETHPYEEPAYDIFQLAVPKTKIGLGLAGKLETPISGEKLIDTVTTNLTVHPKIAGPKPESLTNLAVCGGSGGKLIKNAIQSGVDALITGDIKYHEALMANEQGLLLIDAGHRETELPAVKQLAEYINEQLGEDCDTEVMVSRYQGDVFY